MDGEAMAAEARRLRVEEQLSVRQIQQRLGVTKDRLVDWLRDIPPPDWTRRPNAKDDLRARAIELRQDGWSVNDIAAELGVANSTDSDGFGTCRWTQTANGPAGSALTRSS